MDLVREILRVIEARPADDNQVDVAIAGRTLDEVAEHLRVVQDAGLVHGVSISSSSACCIRLTWAGHEFLESTRKETIWQKAKQLAIAKTGGLSFTALTEATKEAVKLGIEGALQ